MFAEPYPPPYPPPVPRRRAGRWVLVAVLLAVVVGVGVLFTGGRLEAILDLVGAGPTPTPTSDAADVQDLSPFYEALNTALADQDREGFFAHVTGDAVAPDRKSTRLNSSHH